MESEGLYFFAIAVLGALVIYAASVALPALSARDKRLAGGDNPDQDGPPLPPGSLGWPIIGHTIEFARDADKYLLSIATKPIVKTNFLFCDTVVISDADGSAKVSAGEGKIVSSIDCESSLPNMKIMFGEGVGNKKGADHKQAQGLMSTNLNAVNMRNANIMFHKVIESYYHSLRLRSLMNTMLNAESMELANISIQKAIEASLAESERKGVADAWMMCSDLGISLSCIFAGIENDFDHPKMKEAAKNILGGLTAAPFDLRPLLSTEYSRGLEAQQYLEEAAVRNIKRRQERMRAGESLSRDLMQQLIEGLSEDGQRGELSDNKLIVDNVYGMFVAAFESTSVFLGKFVQFMCQHPDVQAKAREEIRTIFGSSKEPITRDQLRECTYINQINLEIARLQTGNFLQFRYAIADFEVAGCRVPKGWRVLVRPSARAFDENIFKDPHSFDPDRFGPERLEHKKRGSNWYSFGFGARRCYGERLAQLERQIFAVMLLRDFEVSFRDATCEPQWAKTNLVSYVTNDFLVKFKRISP